MLFRRIAPIILIVASATGLLAQNAKPVSGERRLAGMLGLESQYARMFTRPPAIPDGSLYGMFSVGMTNAATNAATGQLVFTMQWDPSRQFVLSYSWEPQVAAVRQLTKQRVLSGCGRPDKEAGSTLTYGGIDVAFDAKGTLSEVTIRYR